MNHLNQEEIVKATMPTVYKEFLGRISYQENKPMTEVIRSLIEKEMELRENGLYAELTRAKK